MDRKHALAAILLLLGHPAPGRAAGSTSLLLENDSFADTDHNYTSGMKLVWAGGPLGETNGLRRLARWLPGLDENGELRAILGAGHCLFTPDELRDPEPLPYQHPYAAWLYLFTGLHTANEHHWNQWDLALGMVGPAALGEELQTWTHTWSNSRPPMGWDNQLENEPGVLLSFRRGWRPWRAPAEEAWGATFTPYAGASLGNVHTGLGLGSVLRAGRGLPVDQGPPRIRPTLSGSSHHDWIRPVGVYGLLGIEGRFVAHDIFLDGNSFQAGPSVAKKYLVGEVQAGLGLSFRALRLAYLHVLRSAEFASQEGADDFGSLTLGGSWR